MESVVGRSTTWRPARLRRVEPDAVRTWALVATVVLYLAVDGGGYDLVVRSQVAIVVWWIVLVGAAWGLLPATRCHARGLGHARPVRRLRRLDRARGHLVGKRGAQPAGALPSRLLPRPPAPRHRDPPRARAGREAHGPRRRGLRGSRRLPRPRLAPAPRPVPGRAPDGVVPSAAPRDGSAGRSTTGTRWPRCSRSGSRCCSRSPPRHGRSRLRPARPRRSPSSRCAAT